MSVARVCSDEAVDARKTCGERFNLEDQCARVFSSR
jgi:hypothetical protein